jgi:probable HAF family extracellular repeat protein
MAFLWGGITAGPSIAASTLTDMGYTLTDLGTLGGASSQFVDSNAKGQVIGSSRIGGDLTNHDFLYSNGTMTDLGTLGGKTSYATAINGKGQVIGWSHTDGDLARHAFLYSNGKMTDLGPLGGSYSTAFAINDTGQVIGIFHNAEGDSHSFLYSNGKMTDLTQVVSDLFFVDTFFASKVLPSGQIVGNGYRDGHERAFILTVPNK